MCFPPAVGSPIQKRIVLHQRIFFYKKKEEEEEEEEEEKEEEEEEEEEEEAYSSSHSVFHGFLGAQPQVWHFNKIRP